jgi:HK97 family phage major capsid protein
MNISEKRAKLADLQAQASAIHAAAEKEARTLTGDEQKNFDSIINEFDGLRSEIAGDEARAAKLADSANYLAGIQKPAVQTPVAKAEDKAEERTIEGLFKALRAQKYPEYRDMNMTDTTLGGYLVPQIYMPGLKSIAAEGAIIRPRATVIPAGSPPDALINIPVLNQGANGEFSGVAVSWVAEGGTKVQTTAGLTEVELQPYEVCASLNVTDKLLRNAPETAGIFEGLLRGALSRAEEVAFLNGNGAGQPLGIMQSACHIDITRTAATSIGFADVRNMFTRYLASSWSKGLWIANQTTLPQLIAIADAAGNSIYIQGDITKQIPASLFGLPVIFTGMTPVLGTAGDLMLIDPTYYLIKDGAGPFVAASPHVYFTTNVTVIKIFSNVDGDSWVTAPLLLEDASTTVSPFIVLN